MRNCNDQPRSAPPPLPPPTPKDKNNILPFVIMYYSNFSHQFSTQLINTQLTTIKYKERMKMVF